MMGYVIDFIYLIALVPALLFFVTYLRSRWTSTLPGRTSMVLTFALLLVLLLGAWRQFTGEVAPEWFRLTSFFAVAGALWFQFIALLIVQHRKHTRRIERERQEQLDASR